MRSLAVGAALAVAAAAAHGHLAEAAYQGGKQFNSLRAVKATQGTEETNPTELERIANEASCLNTINEFRKKVASGLKDFEEINSSSVDSLRTDENPSKTDLEEFFKKTKCSDLKNGSYKHISEKGSDKVYVFSASKAEPSRAGMTCADALDQWKKGYDVFKGETPPKYTDSKKPYADPNAAAIVGIMQNEDDSQKIFCGTPKGCNIDAIVCYIKPSTIEENKLPVDAATWHTVQEHFKTKPTLTGHKKDHKDCLTAVNAVRRAKGLDLPLFKVPTDDIQQYKVKREESESAYETYEKSLYEITCEDINKGTIKPADAAGYTIIYATKGGAKPPTPDEAVAHWESGFEKLDYNLPPAFANNTSTDEEEEDEEGEEDAEVKKAGKRPLQIYDDSAVAGYVSLMTAEQREMGCLDATGCAKSALICVLKNETLKDGEVPITEQTWEKIQKVKGFTKPKLELRADKENCLEEINAVRSQEGLGLKPFTAVEKKKETAPALSQLLTSVTCENLKAAKVKPVIKTHSSSSLLYYSGSENTCASAVDQWKKGFSKFSEHSKPPKYTEEEEIYKDGEATNFVSLMSEGTETKAKCYDVTGCDEKGVVCELTPPVFKFDEEPISEATWKKIGEVQEDGVASAFSSMAILTSAALAVAGAVFQL